MKKKNWYCVTSSWDEKGRFSGSITSCVCNEVSPLNHHHIKKNGDDVYCDWFPSMKEANDFIKEGLKENGGK